MFAHAAEQQRAQRRDALLANGSPVGTLMGILQ